ncbi:molybdenum-dependent transcriptional regulator [Thiohalocapsa halophila]|uniref:Molybdenum-dependent transcriptional regulator n=1 Tax=Thiohalocapsa halophila TaxID=69359 RepID=A0ABS1CHN2_9GAMM|nr:TOBE domain-containing protein [Thiohalocapsa halophila]MBK1631358.1 molybdenum-dependent transcriptional regulator [Thiohalocapsa halophila]
MSKPRKPRQPSTARSDDGAAPASTQRPEQPPFNVAGRLWLSVDEVAFLGEERIALLEQIDRCGSITRAAKGAGVSYKAAWDAVDAMNNLAPAPVVATATGGRGGGGARLTDAGRRLIAAYRSIAAEYQRFLAGVNAALGEAGGMPGSSDSALELLRRLALRTSARNQFVGRITAVTARTVDAEITLALAGGERITASVTNESVELLGLKPGGRVWALVKAVGVDVLAAAPAAPPPPRSNALCGRVERILRGDGPAEVVIALGSGVTVRGVTTDDHLAELGIREQGEACAVFPASSVIIGVD